MSKGEFSEPEFDSELLVKLAQRILALLRVKPDSMRLRTMRKLKDEYLPILEEFKEEAKTGSDLSAKLSLSKAVVAGRLAPLSRWGCVREAKPGLYEITEKGLEALETGVRPEAEERRKKLRIVGPRSQIPDLVYEPVNEQGVIFLFAKYHKELGIEYIEGVQQGFPDAFGRRKIGKTEYEPVDIEFEFKSIDFKNHQHDPNQCDIIVCWEHNWKECPLEVIELKTAAPEMLSTPKSR